MDITTYQAAAARTMRPDEIAHDGEVKFSRDSALHFAIGLLGEAGELAEHIIGHSHKRQDIVVKEIGDTCWYIAMGATLFGLDLDVIAHESHLVRRPQVDEGNAHDVVLSLNAAAATVGEHIKKASFFGHELDFAKIESQLAVVWWHVPHLARIFGVTVAYIFDENIAKLKRRYPEGFTQLASINRED